MNGSWDAFLTSPVDFAGTDNIITKRETGIEIIEISSFLEPKCN